MQVAGKQVGDEGRWGMGDVPREVSQSCLGLRLGHVLLVCDRYADLVVPNSIQHLERLCHCHKITRIVEIHESTTELRGLSVRFIYHCVFRQFTFKSLFCHAGSISLPAA